MSQDWVARGLAGSSLLVALVGLTWSVISWTRAGPHLRVQALVYRDQLELRISNAGRIPNTVADVVMNGRPHSDRVIGLADRLRLPWRLEPGESKTIYLEHDESLLAPWWRFVRGGWSNLWVLAGSMHQHQVAVVPVAASRAPAKGWRFPPRGSTLRRWIPFAIGTPLIALAASAGDSPAVGGLVAIAALLVIWRGLVTNRSRTFPRRRVERWTLALAVLLAAIETVVAAGRTPWTPIAPWEDYLVLIYALATWTLARAGGPTMVRHFFSEIGELAWLVRARFSRTSPKSGHE